MLISDIATEWKELGAVVIEADMPAGRSVRYTAEFEQLQAELQKLDALAPSKGSEPRIDWQEVIRLSRVILATKSKDLVVAGYLCRGLLEVQGYSGLHGGLQCLHSMIATFWDVLYPEAARMRGRLAALAWISEKVGAAVAHQPPSGKDREEVETCEALVGNLETLLADKLKDSVPKLIDLRDALREHTRNLEFDDTAAKPPNATMAPSLAPLPAVEAITSTESCTRAVEAGVELLWKAASFARRQDSAQAWPYRVVRAAMWLHIDALPPQVEHETRLPPPAAHLAERYQVLIVQEAWKELVDQAEEQIRHTPFWLDLHRYSALALGRFGPSHAKASHAVVAELASFLRRFPEVVEYRFADGTPFANEETQQWIERDVLSVSPAQGTASPHTDDEDLCTDLHAKAQALMGAGQFKEAVNVFLEVIDHTDNPRRRFHARLALARLCLDGNHVKIALSHLEVLDKQLQSGSLESWEPLLALEVLHTLRGALERDMRDAKIVSPDTVRWAEEVYKRLCRFDVLGVLELEGKTRTGFLSR